MPAPIELVCYLHPGWDPQIRPAEASRDWMDASPEAFAYRCLPLDIANAHGWEVPCPCDFSAVWSGHPEPSSVSIRPRAAVPVDRLPVSLFGEGVLTFHIQGLFRTPPGWNMWVGGSPNYLKDGIQPLTGIVETDWSPYTFTMNWRFTRRNHHVSFKAGEPICFFFPLQRGVVDAAEPRYEPLGANPALSSQFCAWSESRNAFQDEVKRTVPQTPSAKWQKRYYRGIDMEENVEAGHETKLRVKPFTPLSPKND